MTLTLRLLAAVAAVFVAGAVAAGTAAAPAPVPMRVTLDIVSAGHDGVATPANFAVRANGTVKLTVRNHTSLFHTFTIRALRITLLVPPHGSATATFVAPYGVYDWRCVICATPGHPQMHRMGGEMYAIVNA
jgi:heme/copper-type cytochrome/quinol oxidase subunit 2